MFLVALLSFPFVETNEYSLPQVCYPGLWIVGLHCPKLLGLEFKCHPDSWLAFGATTFTVMGADRIRKISSPSGALVGSAARGC